MIARLKKQCIEPAGLWETFLTETANLAKASEAALVSFAMTMGQAVAQLEKGGRADPGAHQRFTDAVEATGEVESSMQSMCDALYRYGTHYAYRFQSAPQRSIALTIQVWNRNQM